MELIEQGLEIQGVTAIEDKLQAGVSDALRCLRQASLKVRRIEGRGGGCLACAALGNVLQGLAR